MLMTNTRTHTGKSCMSIDASVCRSMTWYRQDSFYRSITPECRREDYSRCCEGHVMFNDCCVSEYILYFNNVGYIRLVLLSEMDVLWRTCAYERGSACRVSPKMLPILNIGQHCDHYEIEGRLLQYLVEPLRHCHWIRTQHRNSALMIKKFCSSPDFNPIHSVYNAHNRQIHNIWKTYSAYLYRWTESPRLTLFPENRTTVISNYLHVRDIHKTDKSCS